MTELFGTMLNPTGTLVWSGSGELVALVLAGALLAATVGLFLVREPSKASRAMPRKHTDLQDGDRCLPTAA